MDPQVVPSAVSKKTESEKAEPKMQPDAMEQAQSEPAPAEEIAPEKSSSPGLIGQLLRFVLIGGFCALLDFGTYQLLLALGMETSPAVDIARAISFVMGTTTAYFLNRHFTFADGQREGVSQVGGFVLLYTVTFFVTVGVNQWMLHLLPESSWQHTFGWVISQATATTINFVMLKWVIFRRKPQPASEIAGDLRA